MATVTTVKVVDASAACALVFGEPAASDVAAALADARLVGPQLLPFEVANTCWKKIRKHPDKRSELIRAHDLFQRLDIGSVAIDFPQTVILAEETGLTAYDAAYLWIARRFEIELVTLDSRLQAALVS